jgi:hypothetical protein
MMGLSVWGRGLLRLFGSLLGAMLIGLAAAVLAGLISPRPGWRWRRRPWWPSPAFPTWLCLRFIPPDPLPGGWPGRLPPHHRGGDYLPAY